MISKTSLRNFVQQGTFPKPMRIGRNLLRWTEGQLENFEKESV